MNFSHPNPTYTHPHTTHTRRQTDHTIILKLQLGIQYYRYYIVAIHNTLSHAPATHTQQTIILSHVSHTVWENSVRKRGGDFHLQIFCCKFRAKFMPPNLTVWLLGWICLGGGRGKGSLSITFCLGPSLKDVYTSLRGPSDIEELADSYFYTLPKKCATNMYIKRRILCIKLN